MFVIVCLKTKKKHHSSRKNKKITILTKKETTNHMSEPILLLSVFVCICIRNTVFYNFVYNFNISSHTTTTFLIVISIWTLYVYVNVLWICAVLGLTCYTHSFCCFGSFFFMQNNCTQQLLDLFAYADHVRCNEQILLAHIFVQSWQKVSGFGKLW